MGIDLLPIKTRPDPVVSVIMVNRNGGAYLRRAIATCRTAIERALDVESQIEFVLADNGSSDDPGSVLEQELSGVSFAYRMINEPTAGVNFARNAGVAATRSELLFFVDSDVEFDADWLRAFLHAASAHPTVRVFAGRVRVGRVDAPLPSWLALSGPFARTSIVVQCDYGDVVTELKLTDACGPVGPNMGFRRSVFEQFGLFDTRFGLRPKSLVPGAEAEYFDRLLRASLSFIYVPGALVDHPLKASQMTRRYFNQRLHGIGRATSRLRRIRGERPRRLCGLTLWVVRQYLESMAKWAVTVVSTRDAAKRFHARGEVMIALGYLHEDFTDWRRASGVKND